MVILGGLGHVGLPLGIVLASKGLNVCLYDINENAAKKVMNGELPFVEYNAAPLLKKCLETKKLKVSLDPKCITEAKFVIIAIGTPVDEYMNPKTSQFLKFIHEIKQYLNTSQIIIVRSSVFPRTCNQIMKILGSEKQWNLSYCPERIVQGFAINELRELPQIVSGFSEYAIEEASNLFKIMTKKIIRTTIGEAELSKLFSNSWRYIQFAIANQFYMIANDFGEDYENIREIMINGYERNKGLPKAGFSAGPCLLKDTMQIASFNNNQFLLGQAAMNVNEGLPSYIVNNLKKEFDLSKKTLGILGMSYKADVDDNRDSLSYKLSKILKFEGSNVIFSDEYIQNPEFCTKEKLIKSCDIIIVGVPHSNYRGLQVPKNVKTVDLWGIL